MLSSSFLFFFLFLFSFRIFPSFHRKSSVSFFLLFAKNNRVETNRTRIHAGVSCRLRRLDKWWRGRMGGSSHESTRFVWLSLLSRLIGRNYITGSSQNFSLVRSKVVSLPHPRISTKYLQPCGAVLERLDEIPPPWKHSRRSGNESMAFFSLLFPRIPHPRLSSLLNLRWKKPRPDWMGSPYILWALAARNLG